MTLPAQGSIRSLGPKTVSNLSDSSDDTVLPTAAHGYRGRSVCRSHHAQTRQTDHPIPVEAIVNECAIGRSCGKPLHIRSPVVRWAPSRRGFCPNKTSRTGHWRTRTLNHQPADPKLTISERHGPPQPENKQPRAAGQGFQLTYLHQMPRAGTVQDQALANLQLGKR